MFSDTIHNAYMEIYNGVRDYSEYCSVQKDRTILAMLNLYIIMYAFTKKDSTYKVSDDTGKKKRHLRDKKKTFWLIKNDEPKCPLFVVFQNAGASFAKSWDI